MMFEWTTLSLNSVNLRFFPQHFNFDFNRSSVLWIFPIDVWILELQESCYRPESYFSPEAFVLPYLFPKPYFSTHISSAYFACTFDEKEFSWIETCLALVFVYIRNCFKFPATNHTFYLSMVKTSINYMQVQDI